MRLPAQRCRIPDKAENESTGSAESSDALLQVPPSERMMGREAETLMPFLRRITWADGKPSFDPEDFNVLVDERAVGRIYHTTGGARGEGYAWFIYRSPRSGFAPTRDQAAAEWKAAFERWQGEETR